MSSLTDILKYGNFSKFVQIKSNQELIEEFLSRSNNPIEDEATLSETSFIVSDLFSSLTKEGKTTFEIFESFNNPKKYNKKSFDEIAKNISIFYINEKNKNYSVLANNPALPLLKGDLSQITGDDKKTNANPGNESRITSPGFSVILHNKKEYRAGSKNSLELQVFTSLLTNLEMSKCYPYFDAKFFLPNVLDKNKDKEYNTGNITNFLFGTLNGNTVYESFKSKQKKQAENSSSSNNQSNKEVISGQIINSSVFTAPQTLNNFNESYGLTNNVLKLDPDMKNKRLTAVHDIARPFMTFKNFSIDVAPTKGLMSFKTGRMSLVLHDRTRLNEVSPFIKPELFGPFGSEISVEYGWKHIQGKDISTSNEAKKSDNIIADYIHNSRIKENYIITNSSFNIDQSGQVNIDLNLAMKGPIIFKHSKISSEPAVEKQASEFFEAHKVLVNVIKEINNKKEKKDKIIYNKKVKEINALFGQTAITNLTEDQNTKINELKKIKNKPNDLLKFYSIENVKDKKDKAKILDALNDVTDSIFNLQTAVSKRVTKNQDKIKEFKFTNAQADVIFKDGESQRRANQNKVNLGIKEKFKISEFFNFDLGQHYTFGNVLTKIIYRTFISEYASQFDEVQIVFYNLNNSCGLASGLNISDLLISKDGLQTLFEEIFSNNVTLSVEGFVTNIIKDLIQTEENITYGISHYYDKKKKERKKTKDKPQKKKEETAEDYQKRISSINYLLGYIYKYLDNENFVSPEINNDVNILMPSIHISFDSIPISSNGVEKTLCRISVYDRNENPFGSLNRVYEKSLNEKGSNNLFALSKEIRFLLNQIKVKESSNYFKTTLKNKIIRLIDNDIIKLSTDANKTITSIEVNNNLEFDKEIKDSLKDVMPTFVFGQENSPMLEASVSSINDAKFDTVIMTRNGNQKSRAIEAKFNEKLPLNVKPTQAQVTMIGCPFVNFAQNIFLDFNTGTTIDNRYNVTGLKHDIVPGKFTTSLTLSYGEAFGKYETAISNIVAAVDTEQGGVTDASFTEKASKNRKYTIKVNTELLKSDSIKSKYNLDLKVLYLYKGGLINEAILKYNKQNEDNIKCTVDFYISESNKDKITITEYITSVLHSKKVTKDFSNMFDSKKEMELSIKAGEKNETIKFKIKNNFSLSPSLKITKGDIQLVNEFKEVKDIKKYMISDDFGINEKTNMIEIKFENNNIKNKANVGLEFLGKPLTGQKIDDKIQVKPETLYNILLEKIFKIEEKNKV